MHSARVAWKTTVSVMWVGTRGKVRSCPPVVGIFVGLLPPVEGEDSPGPVGLKNDGTDDGTPGGRYALGHCPVVVYV